MNFASREEAGRRLGRFLQERNVDADLVLGLPRGGVVVAAAVAEILNRPLDVLVVRKIGHPRHREFAVGALAEADVLLLDEVSLSQFPVPEADLKAVMDEERARLREYRARFRRPAVPSPAGCAVLLVDDGLATGATAEAAARSARKQGARKIIVAAPVASPEAVSRLHGVADDVAVLFIDPAFQSVGPYYREFPQIGDPEVIALLPGALPSGN